MVLALYPLDARRGGATAVRQVKVCQHDVTRVMQQDVFWLQIPVDEPQKV